MHDRFGTKAEFYSAGGVSSSRRATMALPSPARRGFDDDQFIARAAQARFDLKREPSSAPRGWPVSARVTSLGGGSNPPRGNWEQKKPPTPPGTPPRAAAGPPTPP